MDVVTLTAIGAGFCGAVAILAGVLSRHEGGWFLIFLGAGMIVGQVSPLAKGRVSESVQMLSSVGSILLSIAGSVAGLLEAHRRWRGAHAKDRSR